MQRHHIDNMCYQIFAHSDVSIGFKKNVNVMLEWKLSQFPLTFYRQKNSVFFCKDKFFSKWLSRLLLKLTQFWQKFKLIELSHEIMSLVVICYCILQMHLLRLLVELAVWFWAFVLCYTWEGAVKALACLHIPGCAGTPEPLQLNMQRVSKCNALA